MIASQRGNELYLLERNSKEQKPKRVNDEDSVQVIRSLYGEPTYRSVLNALSDYSSTAVLSYLVECTVSPQAIQRGAGDPQIQQLAMWIQGYAQKSSSKLLTFVDIGAGNGDLLDAICASGCGHQIMYIPVEPNERYWESIQMRMRQTANLEFQDVRKTAKDVKDADVVFLVNVLHELDLHTRVELISQSLGLTYDRGVVVIHEVANLPIGEADFVMWSGEDLRTIFENAKMQIYITSARTKSRPGGWPIETICIKALEPPPESNRLLKGAILSLPGILKRWTDELALNPMSDIRKELRDRIKAFRMAQVANLSVWNQKYGALKV